MRMFGFEIFGGNKVSPVIAHQPEQLMTAEIKFIQVRGNRQQVEAAMNHYTDLLPHCYTATFRRLPQSQANEVAVALKKGPELYLIIIEKKVPFFGRRPRKCDTIQSNIMELQGDYDRLQDAINDFGQHHCIRHINILHDGADLIFCLNYYADAS